MLFVSEGGTLQGFVSDVLEKRAPVLALSLLLAIGSLVGYSREYPFVFLSSWEEDICLAWEQPRECLELSCKAAVPPLPCPVNAWEKRHHSVLFVWGGNWHLEHFGGLFKSLLGSVYALSEEGWLQRDSIIANKTIKGEAISEAERWSLAGLVDVPQDGCGHREGWKQQGGLLALSSQ